MQHAFLASGGLCWGAYFAGAASPGHVATDSHKNT